MEHLDPRRSSSAGYVYCSGTLNGNPLGAAAGLATLRVLAAPGTYEALEQIAEALRNGLREAAATVDYPLQVAGEGAMAALIFADGDPLDPATPARSDAERRSKVATELMKRGIFVNLPSKFYISTEHDEEQVQATVDAFAEAIAAAG
jgi:glutamate-1-semialdehyde 2,1-aminomutase